MDIKELDVIKDIKILNNEEIINTLKNEFDKLLLSSIISDILKGITGKEIDPNQPYIIEDNKLDFVCKNGLGKLGFNNKNYYLEMNYYTHNNIFISKGIDNNEAVIYENDYIDKNKLENSKCFTYNKNCTDKLNKYILDLRNNSNEIYNKIMIANNNIDKLDRHIGFLDSYLYELDEYNSLICEILEYINKFDAVIKTDDKYKNLYQFIDKLNHICSNLIKDIDDIRYNINLLYNDKNKDDLLNEIKDIFDLIKNKYFVLNITSTTEFYVDQFNTILYMLDLSYEKANNDNSRRFLKEKADNILKNIKDVEDNVSMLNKCISKVENYFNIINENIQNYNNHVSTLVSKDNFIPKEIYNTAFNLRNYIKQNYDCINFESYFNKGLDGCDSQIAKDILNKISINIIDENIINDFVNKLSVSNIKPTLEYIVSHNKMFYNLLNSVNEINKNDMNLNNYIDMINNNIKYKSESVNSYMFLTEEEIKVIESIDK